MLRHLKYFPHPYVAHHNGLLAFGGDLNVQSLIMAYRFGIFPMFSEGQKITWWAPPDRFVIDVGRLHVPKSMRRFLNNPIFTVTLDQHFDQIIAQCQQTVRAGQSGTWITTDIRRAYNELHELGLAHSVEVWQGDKIVGGLYGLGIGKIFSGESMFSHVSNSSKFAAIILDQILVQLGFWHLDCQMHTPHMELLGGYNMDRKDYWKVIRQNLFEPLDHRFWKAELLPEKFRKRQD